MATEQFLVKIKDASGAEITKPADDVIVKGLNMLNSVVQTLKPTFSSQIAVKHLIDFKTWIQIAIGDFLHNQAIDKAAQDAAKPQESQPTVENEALAA